MKSRLNYFVSSALLISGSLLWGDRPTGTTPEVVTARPQIEVAFVLDTTGSMGGLIAGAKEKIWSIANEISSASERPQVKFGLIGYRDRKDDYVTQVYDLSEDLDAIYAHLMEFQAGGGGDQPESVNQALWEGVNQLSWSSHPDTLRLLFLVGDAPPHMDYEDDVLYSESCQKAVADGIIVNTIQCGSIDGTRQIWEEIANLSQGEYVAIQQSGGMESIRTPMDDEIAELNRQMADTVIVYGDSDRQRVGSSKVANARGASAETAADRYDYLERSADSTTFAPAAISGEEDLVAELAKDSIKIEELEPALLPSNLQDLPESERIEYIEQKTKLRNEIQGELSDLLSARREYLEAENEKLKEAGYEDSFDSQVKAMVRKQGAGKGLTYE